jgi:hypothetical protein
VRLVEPSQPRFRSQVFSTSQRFPGRSELCGLVSCHNRPWDPPFRAFPSQGSRSSLEVAGSLAVIHRCAEVRCALPFTPGFPDFHAFTQLPGSPSDYGLRFNKPRLVSLSSWALLSGFTSFRQLHLLRSFPPPVRPFLQPWVAPPLPVVSLLGFFFPFEAFSCHALDSLPAPASWT